MDTDITDAQLIALREAMTEPAEDECVLCYVARMLQSLGCDTTLRWTRHWRDRIRPRATALERRFEAVGGFCVPDGNGEEQWPAGMPACAGLAPRSAQPCANWQTWRRRGW
jgi:hypothetical protein